KIIVHVSNFRKVKRVSDVVSVFDRVLKNGIKAKLLLVGDGPERAPAEKRCREMGICDQVRFLWRRSHVEAIISVADLFIIPSGSETFGLAALDAMGCGVPVISSNIGGLPDVNVNVETGYLCELVDVDQIGKYAFKVLSGFEL